MNTNLDYYQTFFKKSYELCDACFAVYVREEKPVLAL